MNQTTWKPISDPSGAEQQTIDKPLTSPVDLNDRPEGSEWDIGKFRIVTTKRRIISTANISISPSAIRFNLSAAAELEYSPYIRMLVSDDGDKIVVMAYNMEDDTSTAFYQKIYSKKKQQFVDPTSIYIRDKAIIKLIRQKMGWEKGTMKCDALRFQDRQGALFFDLTTATTSEPRCKPQQPKELTFDSYPRFEESVSRMTPVLFGLPAASGEPAEPHQQDVIEVNQFSYVN